MTSTIAAATGQRAPFKIQVWIDFVCPFCLLGETVIRKAADGINVEIEWMPFELRPYPTPTLRPEDEYLPTVWKHSVYPTAKKLGADIRLPTISPQPYSRAAFLGLQLAVEGGKGDQYVDAVLRAFFQKDLDIGDVGVLNDIMSGLDLPEVGLEAALTSKERNQMHDAALQLGHRAGVRAVPSVAVGNRLYSGTPPVDALRAEIITQMAHDAGSHK